MALSIIQTPTGYSTGPPLVTLDTTAVAGNLLLAFQMSQSYAFDNSAPSGFTIIQRGSELTGHRGVLSYKVSDGTETSITGANNGSRNTLMIIEIGGSTPTTDVSEHDETYVLTTTVSCSTGTTGTTTYATGLACALVGNARSEYWNGIQTWTNDFVMEAEYAVAANQPGIHFGTKSLSSIGAHESTCTTDKQKTYAYGSIVIVYEPPTSTIPAILINTGDL